MNQPVCDAVVYFVGISLHAPDSKRFGADKKSSAMPGVMAN
jgi:hypothetical protein